MVNNSYVRMDGDAAKINEARLFRYKDALLKIRGHVFGDC